jgi:hypothetical protein
MGHIREYWGALIQAACQYSSVPPAFLGALIANESGGKEKATRFEPGVFARLKAAHPEWTEARQRAHASSWGLTQIMGLNYPGEALNLLDPGVNLEHAVVMLSDFAERYSLDLRAEFAELFRCWNTGGPYGETADPEYVPKGLARMKIYEALGNRPQATEQATGNGQQPTGEAGA